MQTTINNETRIVNEPRIISANTYFWSSASAASSRRSNEERHQASVAAWFDELGMNVTRWDDKVKGSIHHPVLGLVEAWFVYRESCHNVYKTLKVMRAGCTSNVLTLRKIAAYIADPAALATDAAKARAKQTKQRLVAA
jgi:hypothetical protein